MTANAHLFIHRPHVFTKPSRLTSATRFAPCAPPAPKDTFPNLYVVGPLKDKVQRHQGSNNDADNDEHDRDACRHREFLLAGVGAVRSPGRGPETHGLSAAGASSYLVR